MRRLPLLLLVAVGSAAPALGCAVCYGAADHPMTTGMNLAILTLLGFVGMVYVGALRFFWQLRKRAGNAPVPQPKLRVVQGGKS